jgi:hypothetical protein
MRMRFDRGRFGALLLALGLVSGSTRAQVLTEAALVAAVTQGAEGSTVLVGPGTFELSESLRPKRGMTIRGAGMGQTILRNRPTWAPGNAGLDQDEGAQLFGFDCSRYLINLGRDTGTDIVLSDMTLEGPQLHGGVCGIGPHRLQVMRVEFRRFLWAGIRTYIMDDARIHDNRFFDSGNKANVTSGSSGGALFLTYFKNSEIWNNRFTRSAGNDGYGIKGREARGVRIHHNTIDVFFSIELPFEFDYDVDVDHNYLGGAVSLPKFEGAPLPPDGGASFRFHHNVFKTSYAFEFHRNALEIDHNLFDFDPAQDDGNLISGFDSSAAAGWTRMHDNLVRNPGRGLYWNEGVYNRFEFFNNHVRGQTTVTPRTEGLFEFRPMRSGATTDFSTIKLRDNVFELTGTARPLLRNVESRQAVIENNTLVGISDASSLTNPDAGRPRGPSTPLCFRVGVDDEWTVNGWSLVQTPSPKPVEPCAVSAGTDAGVSDGGLVAGDAGLVADGGVVAPTEVLRDAGVDGGVPDAVVPPADPGPVLGGCSCGASSSLWSSVGVALLLMSRKRRPQPATV